MKTALRMRALIGSALALTMMQGHAGSAHEVDAASSPIFIRTSDVVPFETATRRVWGAPVVADLDGDGWQDIVTTEHERAVRVFWNNEGTYSDPVEIVRGDTHGMGVEDLDGDGRMDLVISRGGGDGSNPRRPVRFIVNHDRTIEDAGAYDYFEPSRGRAVRFLDANGDGALDLLYTGFATNQNPELTPNQLYLNNAGALEFAEHLPHTRDPLGFQLLSTDFNNDGVADLIMYAGRDIVAVQGHADGTYTDVTSDVLPGLARTGSVSGIVEIDYDNDGDFDLFMSRSTKQFEEERYYDPLSRRFAFFEFRNEWMFDDLAIDGDLVLTNLQESWRTYGVFLGANRVEAELTRDDHHMGGNLVVRPEDAPGFPEGDLEGLHIGYLGDGVWRVGGNVHSRLAGVIENVVSSPTTMQRAPLPAMLLENRDGRFIDVTAELGIDVGGQTTGVEAGDFDNDGWVDLAVLSYGDMVRPLQHFVLMNQGGQGFVRHDDPGLLSQEIGSVGASAAIIDYNRDGRIDLVYGNDRGRWYLAGNAVSDTEIGNYLMVAVDPSPENSAPITDARVTVTACGRAQTRKVGTNGDGFHHMVSNRVHFGLGDCAVADSVEVRWYNGESAQLSNIPANRAVSSHGGSPGAN